VGRHYENLKDSKFGRLLVMEYQGKGKWYCKCDCGGNTVVNSGDLKLNRVTSCGCFKSEYMIEKNTTHGLRKSRLYRIYNDMKSRCYNTNVESYESYGNRGILICNEWLNSDNGFITFYNWANENGYSDKLSIDRIDVNDNYESNNCRWTTMKVQGNNKRSNKIIIINDETRTLSEWCDFYKINYKTVQDRLKRNWGIIDALTKPVNIKFRKEK